MTDLLSLSATAAAALIRRRRLSPVEYVQAVLDGIGRTLDPDLDLLTAFLHVLERSRLHKHYAHSGQDDCDEK